ncbi:S24/S26 family peptidase [Chloracidobacterium aggregatum]|uniref:S24/S26 family peptidase n=1 Tax=Chloracidobacterium sp. N TaxID=2821540 RepID=A0ABX8B0I9_9BACT|nr:S24/S26 family peptidase [Chloracidobacterium aggregatum]QUV85225.1 S24/S26 family peptidase [Chloracidobacterium sp. 2]QUV88376.1 S24/S26 family peptidase [Chloracidobacterium sp. S]QUV91293.1 S24/S26 family peptidase [Chloracidobacterium sp. A]QUV94474.1 S24/S26 family peptidase [Chloracidobacterium sp. N]QUV97676.1 S24/S26 family peptidase [Chloracidobacterium sp. E]
MRTTGKTKTSPIREHTLESPDILRTARAELMRDGVYRFRVNGSTMRPTISDGDWLTVEQVPTTQLGVGDIVLLCTSSQTAVVHRILRFEQRHATTYVVTRGDAAEGLDVSVPVSNVVGRVLRIESNGVRHDLTTFWRRLRTRLAGWLHRWRFRKVKSV